jgi:hypothetical protein
MGFEEGVDPVDGWSAPRQALVLIATRSLPLWAQIMSAVEHSQTVERVAIRLHRCREVR